MTAAQVVLILVAAQRGMELLLASRNTRWLRAHGGIEIDAGGYSLFPALHAGWLAAIAAAIGPGTTIVWPLLIGFGLLQLGRVWVIATLGRRWTTRIIVLPRTPLVATGPYRWFRHPNYLVVAGEIALLPLAVGATEVAIVFSLLNLMLLNRRIRMEDGALKQSPSGLM